MRETLGRENALSPLYDSIVIGAGEPFLPGISLGHNRTAAFGLTIFAVDQEDLYTYETNPAAPDEYRYAGRWEAMTVRREMPSSTPAAGVTTRA